jgi:hypothetical protein
VIGGCNLRELAAEQLLGRAFEAEKRAIPVQPLEMPLPIERPSGPDRDRAEDAVAEGQPAVGGREGVARFAVDEDQW